MGGGLDTLLKGRAEEWVRDLVSRILDDEEFREQIGGVLDSFADRIADRIREKQEK